MKRIIALLSVLTLVLGGCGRQTAVPAEKQLFAMDTFMDLKAYGDGAEDALADASDLLNSMDAALSVTNESSEIYAVNHSGGKPVSLSDETFSLLSDTLMLSEELDGTVDITIYPVSRAWGFTTGEYQIPTEETLSALLPLVDDSKVSLDPDTKAAAVPSGAELDLGAAAKGRAADRAAALLKNAGVSAAILNLGSSTIFAFGTKPDGSQWRVAIQDPEDPEGYAGILEIDEGSVNTSGGYQRYFIGEDGETYWHILNPATGYPARTGLLSVTVLTPDALRGDLLSTALFVMGPEKAQDFWKAHQDFDFIMIMENGSFLVSQGAAEIFTPAEKYRDAEIQVITHEN